MKFNFTESEHLQIEIFLNFDWLVRVSQHWAKRPQGKDEGGGGKKRKKTYRKKGVLLHLRYIAELVSTLAEVEAADGLL